MQIASSARDWLPMRRWPKARAPMQQGNRTADLPCPTSCWRIYLNVSDPHCRRPGGAGPATAKLALHPGHYLFLKKIADAETGSAFALIPLTCWTTTSCRMAVVCDASTARPAGSAAPAPHPTRNIASTSAVQLARQTVVPCSADGYNVSASVVDRSACCWPWCVPMAPALIPSKPRAPRPSPLLRRATPPAASPRPFSQSRCSRHGEYPRLPGAGRRRAPEDRQ
jgi:hypothetical protein